MNAPRSGPDAPLPVDRRAGVQERAALETEGVLGLLDVDRARRSTRVIRAYAVALASARRASAMTLARSASVPSIGGCQSLSVTVTAWPRRASAKSWTPEVGNGRRLERTAGRAVACGGFGHDALPRKVRACRVASRLDRKTEAPAAASVSAVRVRPCGSPSVPVTDTTTGSARPPSRAARLAARWRRRARRPGPGARRSRARGRAAARRSVGSAASAAMRSMRSVGSIIGWARPWVSPSSPKSMTRWPASLRSDPSARSSRAGCWSGCHPARRRPASIASSARVPPQKSPRRLPSTEPGSGSLSDDPASATRARRGPRPRGLPRAQR